MAVQTIPTNQDAQNKDNIILRLVPACVILCIKCRRVGQFNARAKHSQLENSQSYCILRSLSERAITREIFFKDRFQVLETPGHAKSSTFVQTSVGKKSRIEVRSCSLVQQGLPENPKFTHLHQCFKYSLK